ncbi:MAG: hypothetical protein COA69_09650 [Robiginitomaculum sp.]|nr:MAG: hypothetical protein COA69_09650 [Robiginitomaculum sp.]
MILFIGYGVRAEDLEVHKKFLTGVRSNDLRIKMWCNDNGLTCEGYDTGHGAVRTCDGIITNMPGSVLVNAFRDAGKFVRIPL